MPAAPRVALAIVLAMMATTAGAKRGTLATFAEPGDIIAAEGNFTHLAAQKGVRAAIRATGRPQCANLRPAGDAGGRLRQ